MTTPGLNLQEASQLMAMVLPQVRDLEDHLAPRYPLPTIACIAALILARAAWSAHMHLAKTGQSKGYRNTAHAFLADVLDQAELLMTETEGRA